jgi:hypothetical protein
MQFRKIVGSRALPKNSLGRFADAMNPQPKSLKLPDIFMAMA